MSYLEDKLQKDDVLDRRGKLEILKIFNKILLIKYFKNVPID